MKKYESDALNLTVPRFEPPPGLEDKIMAAVQKSPRVVKMSPWVPWLTAAVMALAAGNVTQLVLNYRPVAAPSVSQGSAVQPARLAVVMLSGTEEAPKAFGTIVLDPEDNHGVLAVRDLPASSGRYDLWLRTDTERLNAGTFEVNDDGYGALLLMIPKDFTGFHEFRLCPAGTKRVVMSGRY